MTRRHAWFIVGALPVVFLTAQSPQLSTAIDHLGSFDFPTRRDAAKLIRRAEATDAVKELTAAARSHRDEYVRYRALVLLAGFGDGAVRATMRDLISDKNDRVRGVVYAWYERHKDPAIVPTLIDALGRERSEFVQPALTRALAAYGDDKRVRDALLPLVMRGEDLFRGSLISALGDYRATYAVKAISDVAKLDGPLQDDAITALVRIGDPSTTSLLGELRRTAPAKVQPTIIAGECVLGFDCQSREQYLTTALRENSKAGGDAIVLGDAAHAMAILALAGRSTALDALFDSGNAAPDRNQDVVAIEIGVVALRNASLMLQVLEARRDRDASLNLLRAAFDILSEDFEEECFYVDVRHAYWSASAGSPRRQLLDAIIQKLEF